VNSDSPHDARRALAQHWLQDLPPALGLRHGSLRPASSDASFRRYFRVDAAPATGEPASYIVMDAPPEHEDCRPFVRIAALIGAQGVSTPTVVASDLARGLLLLSDFGSTTYADALQQPGTDVQALYEDALGALVRLQQAQPGSDLPPYDRARLLAEMQLFPEWYVGRHLGMELTGAERQMLDGIFERLIDAAGAQAAVLVHRDYHCRNLMVLAQRARNPGVLDFQDAVVGPVTYDLVSLLRDAYVEWPEAQQIDWAARYWDLARAAKLPVPGRFDAFWQDMEWMGLQRALKVLGIFARLCHRDGKARYLDDLPLVLRHTQRVVERYDSLRPLARLLDRLHQRTPRTGFTF
jgi:aminoglycoside/choline kinase family phosphotransferase